MKNLSLKRTKQKTKKRKQMGGELRPRFWKQLILGRFFGVGGPSKSRSKPKSKPKPKPKPKPKSKPKSKPKPNPYRVGVCLAPQPGAQRHHTEHVPLGEGRPLHGEHGA